MGLIMRRGELAPATESSAIWAAGAGSTIWHDMEGRGGSHPTPIQRGDQGTWPIRFAKGILTSMICVQDDRLTASRCLERASRID